MRQRKLLQIMYKYHLVLREMISVFHFPAADRGIFSGAEQQSLS